MGDNNASADVYTTDMDLVVHGTFAFRVSKHTIMRNGETGQTLAEQMGDAMRREFIKSFPEEIDKAVKKAGWSK